MYMGEIKQWNDARIKTLNPKLILPAQAIIPVYRSDRSGTNFLLTNYLSQVSPSFSQKMGPIRPWNGPLISAPKQ